MSGKIVKWTSRRKRRALAFKKKFRFFLYFALAATAMIMFKSIPAQLSAPVVADTERESAAGGSSGSSLLQRMLADNIPGMEQPAPAGGEELRGVVLSAFHALTGLDPRDPRSILERELGAGALFALPVLHPPEGSQPESDENDETADVHEEPEAPAPVFNPRFPFLGYSEPVALVYHTHITESFEPTSGVRYSQNLEQTVARLGEDLVKLLQEDYGLPLLHHRGVYDLPRTPAYEKARPEVEQILAENPQLDMVIDLHRDGVRREVTTTTLYGVEAGKTLIVIGTRHPGWESNLAFALCLHRELEVVAPGISRGVRQQNYGYNQDLHPNAILVEVGGHENTMEEAMRTIPYLAEALARAYYAFFVQD